MAGTVAGGPPLGVEPTGAEPGHAGQQLVDGGVGEHPEHRGIGERGVGEVDRPQVGPFPGQLGADQGQVVILDQHPAALGGDRRHPFGEQPVVVPVGLPRLRPPPIGPRSPGGIEEVVVAEPQGGVGDDVVGHPIDVRVQVEELDAESVLHHEALVGRLSVGVAQCTGHPGGPGARHHRVQGPGQPTRAWLRTSRPLVSRRNESGPRLDTTTRSSKDPWDPGSVGGPAMTASYSDRSGFSGDGVRSFVTEFRTSATEFRSTVTEFRSGRRSFGSPVGKSVDKVVIDH